MKTNEWRTHYTDLQGPAQELFNALDDLSAYLWAKAQDGTSIPHENVTIRKAREVLRQYAAPESR